MKNRDRYLLALFVVASPIGAFVLWRTGVVEFKLYDEYRSEHNATVR